MSSSPSDSDVVLPEWIAARAAAHRVRRGTVGRARSGPVSRRAATSTDSDSDSDSDGEEGGVRLDVSPYRPPQARSGLAQSQPLADNYGSETTASPGFGQVNESQAATAGNLSPTLPARQRPEHFQVGSAVGGDLFASGEETDDHGSSRLNDPAIAPGGIITSPLAVRASRPAVFGQFQISSSTGSTSSDQVRMPSLADNITRLASSSRGGGAFQQAHGDSTALSAIPVPSGLVEETTQSTDTTGRRPFRTPGPRLAPARSGIVSRRAISYPSEPVNVDAQEIFPEEACLYAANLPSNHTHERIAAELQKHFAQFGHCIVKMKTKDGLPMAFVQFTQLQNAMTALGVFNTMKARGEKTLILGREIRLEVARGNRPWIVSKRDGTPVSIDEAMVILRPSGEIASADYITPEIQNMLNLAGPSVLVKFKEFKPNRSLHRDFRGTTFKVFKYEPEKRSTDLEDMDPEEYLAEEDINMRSIFIKPIPLNMTEERLKAIFEKAGDVAPNGVRLNLDARPYAIAFVQFARDDMPDTAVQLFHGRDMGWGVLRVERKLRRQFRPLGRKSGFANMSSAMDAPIGAVRRVLGPSPVRRAHSTYVTPIRRNETPSAALVATAPQPARELVVRQSSPEISPPTQTAIETRANTLANAQRELIQPSPAPPATHTNSPFSATAPPFVPQTLSSAPLGAPPAFPGFQMPPAYSGPLVPAGPSTYGGMMNPHQIPTPQQYGMPAIFPGGAAPAGWPAPGFPGGFPLGPLYQSSPYVPGINAPAFSMYTDQQGNVIYGFVASNNSVVTEVQTPGNANTPSNNNVGRREVITTGSPAIPATGASGSLRPHTSNRSVSFAEPLVQPGNSDSEQE